MKHVLLTTLTLALVSLQLPAHASSFLEKAAKLYDCKYKEIDFGSGVVASQQLLLRVPGTASPTCVTRVQCVRNEVPNVTPWAQAMELYLVCSAPDNSCPVTAMECLKDPIATTASEALQTNPNGRD